MNTPFYVVPENNDVFHQSKKNRPLPSKALAQRNRNLVVQQYRVTIQVFPNLPLTSKQKLCFSISPLYFFVFMSTGGWELPVWSPCKYTFVLGLVKCALNDSTYYNNSNLSGQIMDMRIPLTLLLVCHSSWATSNALEGFTICLRMKPIRFVYREYLMKLESRELSIFT